MNQPQQQGNNPQNIQIRASEEMLKGKYATHMQVMHTKEEFIFDYFTIFPPQANLVSRIIINPKHAKRIAAALQDNIKKYEDQFGKIDAGTVQDKEIGFKVD